MPLLRWPAKSLSLDQAWKTGAPVSTQIKRINRSLRSEGWRMLPAWDWVNVWIRAERAGVTLNLVIHDSMKLSLETALRDIREDGRKMSAVIGIVSNEKISEDQRNSALRTGTFVVTPAELCDISRHVTDAERARKLPVSPIEPEGLQGQDSDLRKDIMPPTSKVVGFVESIGKRQIFGWAYLPDDPGQHLRAQCFVDNRLIAESVASGFREDLKVSGIGEGNHAFGLQAPHDLPRNTDDIKVVVLTSEGKQHHLLLTRKCRQVIQERLNTEPRLDSPVSPEADPSARVY